MEEISNFVIIPDNIGKLINPLLRKMLVLIMLCFITVGFNDVAYSSEYQQSTVGGTITDQHGTPIVGVTVLVKGTSSGSISDASGKYSLLNVPQNATLVFSFVGMTTQEIPLVGRTIIDVIMVEAAIGLDEIVVVGYGTQKKVNLTGAVASVEGEKILMRPVSNASSMLQGMLPGLQVTQQTGEPGNEGVTLRIRGQGTFSSAGNDPLVLIDGIPGSMTNLDPNTIESVSILKDAASAAIYGSRGANGVILVTTKTGSEGKLQVEYGYNNGTHFPTKLFDVITNSAEYMRMFNLARTNTGLTAPSGLYTQEMIDLYENATDRDLYPNYDWVHAGIKPAPTDNHNLSFNGTSGNTRYNVSLGYYDQNGTMIGFDYKRYNARINLTSQVNKKVKFGAIIGITKGDRNAYRGGQNEQFLSLLSQAPTYKPQLPDGSGRYTYKAYAHEYNNKNTFAVTALGLQRNTNSHDLTTQGWVEVDVLKGLSWYAKAAYNGSWEQWSDYGPTVQLYNYITSAPMALLDVGTKGRTQNVGSSFYYNIYSYLNYDRTFGGHSIKAQAGYSQEKNDDFNMRAARTTYVSDNYTELDAGSAAIQTNSGNHTEWALMSYFGRINYGLKDRYLLELNMRLDGTSRLSPDTRWGRFPSVSAAWRVTEEPFIRDLGLQWLNNFKVRGSYGQLGNQNIGTYPYQANLSFTGNYSWDNTNLTAGVAQTELNNLNIRWETTTIADLGFDLTVLNGLSISFDAYNKTTSDILRSSQVTNLVGLSAPTINNGTMRVRGVELGINYNNSVKSGVFQDLNYYAGVNLEHYKNKLINYGAKEIASRSIRQEGYEWDMYYLIEWIGIFQSVDEVAKSPKQYNDLTVPGDLKYKDQLTVDSDGDGIFDKTDGVINDDDRIPMKGAYPNLNYSFNFGSNWKGFDLSAQFQGVEGTKVYGTDWGWLPFRQGSPPTTMWRNAWTDENQSQTLPRLYWGENAPQKLRRNCSWYLHDAAYFRLKNLTFGYTLPGNLTRKAGIDRLRLYFSGDNLMTLTKFPGLDPERPSSTRFAQYPQNKIYSFGVNVNF